MPSSGVYRNNTLLLPRSPIFVFTHPRLGATGGRARHALGYAVHGQICGGRGVMARGSWPLALVLVRNKLKPEHAQPPVYVRTCAAVLLQVGASVHGGWPSRNTRPHRLRVRVVVAARVRWYVASSAAAARVRVKKAGRIS